MPEQPSGAQANADVTEEGLRIGEEYDKNRKQAEDDRESDVEEIEDGRVVQGTGVVTGTAPTMLKTQYPGAALRGLADDADGGGVAVRAAKGLPTDDVVTEDTTWTAQSATAYVSSNAENVPGQTFSVDELPDPAVVNASALPSHVIPAELVVDAVKTDNLNTSQEAGGDAGTAPAKDDESTRATTGARKAPAKATAHHKTADDQ